MQEGFEGQMTEHNIELAVVGEDRKLKILTPTEIRDYLGEGDSCLLCNDPRLSSSLLKRSCAQVRWSERQPCIWNLSSLQLLDNAPVIITLTHTLGYCTHPSACTY
jgi:hypothetical protein